MVRLCSCVLFGFCLLAFTGCGESGNKVIEAPEGTPGVMTDAEMEAYNQEAFGGATEN